MSLKNNSSIKRTSDIIVDKQFSFIEIKCVSVDMWKVLCNGLSYVKSHKNGVEP